MNYDQTIQEIIDVIKADKSVAAEWRNKAIARFKEGRAFIHEGKTTTNRHAPEDLPIMQESCTCPPGGLKRSCSVHGDLAA